MSATFAEHFAVLAGLPATSPHPWQATLASEASCRSRLIRIPTGFGKTLGVLAAWHWNRIVQASHDWPRRLVWCLPMRVLVEQVAAELHGAMQRAASSNAIAVHTLMGGADAADWHLHPDREAILVGTQDMLLSRALNRGYGAGRARWPMDFGLLNQDCLWVLDEVQLMDVGLATSAQLQAFREADAARGAMLRPCRSWWMSATLQQRWLHASPDTRNVLGGIPESRVPPAERVGPLWDAESVRKPLRVLPIDGMKKLAAQAAASHIEGGRGARGPTLVVVNRVEHALQVFDALRQEARRSLKGTDLRLVHSRFRPAERQAWRGEFLHRGACAPGTDRIIVTTQVVEAGVDISAGVLLTELAPWSSLVQRFGRCARWGGTAEVIVADGGAKDDKTAAPYGKADLDAAREALAMLCVRTPDVAPRELEAFEEGHSELMQRLYLYSPSHLLLRQDVDDLFDTSADLSGADIDISRYIRSGDERDLQVFWRAVEPKAAPAASMRAQRDELCPLAFLKARDWLFGKGKRLLPGMRAWVWDWVEGQWLVAEPRHLYPGQTVLVATDSGGYDAQRGWSPEGKSAVAPVPPPAESGPDPDDADRTENDESLSVAAGWQTIAFHGRQVGLRARAMADELAPALSDLLDLAGRWHDAGKAHPAFQACLKTQHHGDQIAKAPAGEWHQGGRLYRLPDGSQRRGFRHELASTLALFSLLRRCNPDHPALLGPWRDLLSRIHGEGALPVAAADARGQPTTPLEAEILALGADDFDLLLYLVCSHHGKVRVSWHASPADQEAQDDALRIRGLRAGDVLPPTVLLDGEGAAHALPGLELVLAPAAAGLNVHTGRGWTERVLGLLKRHGPFTLAWLEALLRAADQRATRDASLIDPALQPDNPRHGLEGSHPPLARVAGSGETPSPLAGHSSQRGEQFRFRGRAGGPGDAGSRTRPPAHATRYVETRLGTLSYLELAPHLAQMASEIEREIESGRFDGHAPDAQLVLTLHRLLCESLTPQLCGWRRSGVVVGTHIPPDSHLVPLQMHEYGLDLQARLAAAAPGDGFEDRLLETLAFAEGRLLSIHPFTDFNGRVTRLFLRLLLRRLDLPSGGLTPADGEQENYLDALRAGDRRNWAPLMDVWRRRFVREASR